MKRFAVLVALLVVGGVRGQEKIVLFNGKDLSGWVAEGQKEYLAGDKTMPVWSVKDGLLVCDGKGFGFLRFDKREFADFTFHVEFRFKPKANSGLGIRTKVFDPSQSVATRPSYACYEIQIVDDAGKPASKGSTGSLYRYVAPSVNASKPAGEWNAIEIQCVGPKIQIVFNDQKIIDFDQTTLAETKDKPTRGYVCLQNHGGFIEFRNVWAKDLKK